MSVLEAIPLSDDVVAFDKAQCIAAGQALHQSYSAGEPFPHIVMDSFIDPGVLRRLLDDWPVAGRDKKYYDRPQERLKYEWQPHELRSARIRTFLAEMNAEPMVRFIEALTGISNLIADPYYNGAGLHEIKRGGHLGIHADFNVHKELNALRRVNLLIYLNDDWPSEFGGDLELWSKDMSTLCHKIAPVMGRAVVFNTELDSFHGHPDPLRCPEDRSRRSIALYYYTTPSDATENIPARTTTFQTRPNSSDVRDWRIQTRHVIQDWTPPALHRAISRRKKGK